MLDNNNDPGTDTEENDTHLDEDQPANIDENGITFIFYSFKNTFRDIDYSCTIEPICRRI